MTMTVEDPKITDKKYVGLLLCGGQSSRMKTDKAFLAVPSFTSSKALSSSNASAEEPLFLHLLKHALVPLPHLSKIIISARDASQQSHINGFLEPLSDNVSVEMILDKEEFKNKGPASGILSARSMYPQDNLIVLAVDFPLADSAALECLIDGHEGSNNSPVTCFLHPEDGNPEPVMSIWTPEALSKLEQNVLKGKSGPCYTAKQIWKEIQPDLGMSEGNGLVRPVKAEWVQDADTPEEWEKIFSSVPRSVL